MATIEIPFGAKDSELKGWEYTIPEGMEAIIENGKVIVREKESEDEKIRKGLVNFLQSPLIKETLTDEKVAPWLAYLEKQKELDKMIVVSPEVWDNAISEAFENEKKEGEKQKEQKPTAEEVLIKAGLKPYKDGNQWCVLAGDNIQEGICGFGDTIEDALYQFLLELIDLQSKQKPAEPEEKLSKEEYVKRFKVLCNAYEINLPEREYDIYGLCEDLHKLFGDIQKPAEWSEEDETRLTNILIMLKEYVIHHYSKDDVNKSVDWLENRVKFLRPVKQEWGEKDKFNLKSCIGKIEIDMQQWGNHGKTIVDGDIKLIEWLKSLPERFELQPKQEWSEEEYGRLFDIEQYLHGTLQLSPDRKIACIDFLKSLRPQPHWKPSEEQMEALLSQLPVIKGSGDAIQKILESLYNDLKKL